MSYRMNRLYGHVCAQRKRIELHRRKKLMDEFKALNNLHPRNLKQAKWILKAITDFVRKHPELAEKIAVYYAENEAVVLDRLSREFSVEMVEKIREAFPNLTEIGKVINNAC